MNDLDVAGNTIVVGYMKNPERLPMVSVSRDNGNTWQDILLKKELGSTKSVYISPNAPNIIYASGRNLYGRNEGKDVFGFVYKSTDGGISFKEVFENRKREYVYAVNANPNNLSLVCCSSDNGILVSSNEGKTWNQAYDETTESTFVTSDGMIFGLCRKGVIISADEGNNWDFLWKSDRPLYQGKNMQYFHRIKVDEKQRKVYAGTKNGLLIIDY
ncbi:WD40/YVTN/BNR-like repeat-containing protein [candidate division KSB1 bacterium]